VLEDALVPAVTSPSPHPEARTATTSAATVKSENGRRAGMEGRALKENSGAG